jgi:site-specific DNA recombinase
MEARQAKQERSGAPDRAAIYARVSSEPQAERGTIQSQIDDLLAQAAADGYPVGEELRFIDNGYSGASLVRPALERLRDLAAMAVVDRLYVHAPDRLARNYAYQAVLVEEFARTGTEVVFLNRPIGQSAEDNLLLQLQGMFAEYERTKMLERSRRGKRHLARAGVLSVMSGAPFGYRYVGREAGDGVPRFDVAETQAEVVRAIFQWVGREHMTLSAVCRRLLEAGVPSPTGLARWGRSTVWNLLSNPTYIGQAAFGKQRILPWQPPLRPAHGRGNLPKHPCRKVNVPLEHRIPISVPSIVDVGLFETVQEQLAESRSRVRQHRGGAKYLLQGLLVCSKCGYAFCGTHKRFHQPQRKQHYYYYRCSRTDAWRLNGERRCDARMMPVEQLDAAVWDEVGRILADPVRVIQEYQRRLDGLQASPRQQELAAVERQLTKLRRGIDRLIDSYTEGVIDKSEFEPRLSALRARVSATEAAAATIRDAAEQARSLTLVIGKIEAFADIIRDRLETADWTAKRDIIRTLVRRIEIDDEVIRVVFRIGPGPSSDGVARHLRVHHCLGRDCLFGEPDRQAPTLPQAGVIRAPVGHPVPLLGDVMPASGIGLERHRGF